VLAGAAASARIGGGGAETGGVLADAAASVRIGEAGAETGAVLAGAAASVRIGGGGAETGGVLAGAAASVRIGGGGAEMGAVLAGAAASDAGTSAAVECGRGGAEMVAALARAAASDAGTSATVEFERGGAEMDAVLAGAARSNAGTIGLRESLGGKNILSPAPTAKEKTMVRAAPNGVLTASTKVLVQSDFLSGRTRTIALPPFFCALISPPSLILETESLVVSRNQQKVRSGYCANWLPPLTDRVPKMLALLQYMVDTFLPTKCRMSALAGSIDASRSTQSPSVSSVAPG